MMFDFFSIIDILSFLGWFTLFAIGAFFVYQKNKSNPEFKYYYYHFYFKLFAGLGFGLVYILYYERHGDTVFYWQGAQKLNELFFDNPSAYFHELFSTPKRDIIPAYFKNVGPPPIWIYNEPNSWFVCKIANFLSFFTFGSYLVLNLFFTIISSWISWRFFRYMNKMLEIKTSFIAIACLFVPSVAFWCSGIIKDTVALSSILVLTMSLFKLIRKDYNSLFWTFVAIIISSYFLISIRPFLILASYLPMFILFVFKLNSQKPFIVRSLTRFVGIGISIIALVLYFRSDAAFGEFSANSVFETAEIIQKDMMNNAGYTGKRYDLGITEFTNANLIKVIPAALNVSLFRPYIWEAENPFMLLNGIENFLILLLTLSLFRRNKHAIPLSIDLKNYILFSLVFVFILGYFVGLTSGLFGTLVRFKAPIIPFFLLFVFHRMTENKPKKLT
ncbi:MAG: hypothetical protein K0S23_2088 [Fluviicola sp.]|jgi:hypothetical protein|uniref:hypothetical protein n=1 Tax=Fluviicola sp. TaxID=1917219 RepID=UPI00261776A9|nr:hypothetical protein [Fluviicola sp.]MDF3027781.1 hypothetical protein [Fluviicola sp.]